MAALNPHTRELVFKIVFYGPGLGGKTTSLQHVFQVTPIDQRGKMVQLATATDRTLYFDYLPLLLGKVRGLGVRLALYTVPGQAVYAATRKLVLSGVDGVVFVADSQKARLDSNLESIDDLRRNLDEQGRDLSTMPHTLHYNKAELPDVLTPAELDAKLNPGRVPSLPTVATKGTGVLEGLERITRLVLEAYEAEHGGGASSRKSRSASASKSPASDATEKALPSDNAPRVDRADPSLDSGRSGELQREQPATAALPSTASIFSFASLFAEAERDAARDVEAALALGDAQRALVACERLVTRALAQVANMLGSGAAPSDPALVVLLLGIPGPRYVQFRAALRRARGKESVAMPEALAAYAFALDVHRAKDGLRHSG